MRVLDFKVLSNTSKTHFKLIFWSTNTVKPTVFAFLFFGGRVSFEARSFLLFLDFDEERNGRYAMQICNAEMRYRYAIKICSTDMQ